MKVQLVCMIFLSFFLSFSYILKMDFLSVMKLFVASCVWFDSSSGPVSAARPQSTKEEEEEEEEKEEEKEEKRLKRKRGDAECHADKKEEGEIKKVCKEGFQLFHHNVCLLFFPLIKEQMKYDASR